MTDHTSPEPLPLWQRLNDFAEAYASGDRRLATLKRDALVTLFLGGPMRPQPEATEPASVWRCFHCDETFTDAAAARAHFGDSERQQAICTIDATHFRWMEEQHRRNVDEDSEALRAIGRLTSEHETLRRRAEEEGYARGLRDAKKYPGELGLISIESASTILDYSVAIFEGLGDAAAISTTAEDVQRDIDHLIETKGPKMERFGPLREQGEQLLADTLKLMRKVHSQRVATEAMRAALEQIARWDGFPSTGEFWDAERTRPVSYGAANGSDGERDFMRGIAREAIAMSQQGGAR